MPYGSSPYSSITYAGSSSAPRVVLCSLGMEIYEGQFALTHITSISGLTLSLNMGQLSTGMSTTLQSLPLSISEGIPIIQTRNPGLSLTGLKVVSAIPSNGENDVALRVSLNRGATWGNEIVQSMGATGQYATSISYRQLGMGRDAVFELSWSSPVATALIGANLVVSDAGT